MDHNEKKALFKKLDWVTTLIPFMSIILLCLVFTIYPGKSADTLAAIRSFLGDELGSYYLIIGLFTFLCSLYIAFSKYGTIKLGNLEKPQYSNFNCRSGC